MMSDKTPVVVVVASPETVDRVAKSLAENAKK
jgi:hypothetical protein